jgi:hypothetical protein
MRECFVTFVIGVSFSSSKNYWVSCVDVGGGGRGVCHSKEELWCYQISKKSPLNATTWCPLRLQAWMEALRIYIWTKLALGPNKTIVVHSVPWVKMIVIIICGCIDIETTALGLIKTSINIIKEIGPFSYPPLKGTTPFISCDPTFINLKKMFDLSTYTTIIAFVLW